MTDGPDLLDSTAPAAGLTADESQHEAAAGDILAREVVERDANMPAMAIDIMITIALRSSSGSHGAAMRDGLGRLLRAGAPRAAVTSPGAWLSCEAAPEVTGP